MLQGGTGVRVRGQLGSGKLSGRAAEAMATVWGVGVSLDPTETPLPLVSKPSQGFGEKDLLGAIMTRTRLLDPQNAKTERYLAESFDMMRKATNLLESDDPQEREAGRAVFEEAKATFERELDSQDTLYTNDRNRTDQELVQAMTRVLRSYNLDEQFDRLSVARRVGTILGSVIEGTGTISNDAIRNMIFKTRAQDGGRMRMFSSERSIEDARQQLDDYLASPPTSRFLPELKTLQRYLSFQAKKARLKQRQRQGRDPLQRGAAELLRRLNR
jgi:hypothetical protein